MKYISARGVLAGVAVVLIATVCIRLGFWQLSRLEERRQRNARIALAMTAPLLDLDARTFFAIVQDPELYRHRRVRVQGVYDGSGSFLLRGRGREGAPGVHLISPLRPMGLDSPILVDRGWLPAPDATTADPRPYREPGPVIVEGRLQPLPDDSTVNPRAVPIRLEGVEVTTYQRLHLATLRSTYSPELAPVYVERSPAPDETDLPVASPAPALDDGPHLGYAIQWFGFAAVAIIGFGVVAARAWSRI